MQIVSVEKEKNQLLISFDYWEIELLGYDVKKKKAVSSDFYERILGLINECVYKYFPRDYKYGVKALIDEKKGLYYYKIEPYEDSLNDFIFSEMRRENKKWITYGNRIWFDGSI